MKTPITCPRCHASNRWNRQGGVCGWCGYGDLSAPEKHIERAVEAIANHLCVCHFTDGFCGPQHRPDCRCLRLARGAVQAMESRGMKPVWVFDKEKPRP